MDKYRNEFYAQSWFFWLCNDENKTKQKADLVSQTGTPKKPSENWYILCGTIWGLDT